MTTPTLDPDAILHAIATWPIEEQIIKFARAVLEHAAARTAASTPRLPGQSPEQSTWEALYGIASNGQEPPTDDQVAQWLDEHRMEKYGSSLGRDVESTCRIQCAEPARPAGYQCRA